MEKIEMETEKRRKVNKVVGLIALSLLGLFCFFYSIFAFDFAELNVRFPFLDFPIFIGEILLLSCILILIIKLKIIPIRLNKLHFLLFTYIGFVLIKAFLGYLKWGPLAFRNAALFYYFLFVAVGYYFFDRNFFKNKYTVFLTSLLFMTIFALLKLKIVRIPNCHFLFTYIILTVILLLSRYFNFATLLFFAIIFPYKSMVTVPRSVLVSEVFSLIFFVLGLFFILKIRLRNRIFIFLSLLIAFWFLLHDFADRADIKTLISSTVIKEYSHYTNLIQEKEVNAKRWDKVPARLYYDNVKYGSEGDTSPALSSNLARAKRTAKAKDKLTQQKEGAKEVTIESGVGSISSGAAQTRQTTMASVGASAHVKQLVGKSIIASQVPEKPRATISDSNISWRIFVWRDMLKELIESKRLAGLDFGLAFRSESAEILGWESGLGRVGWLEPHNSFIHILYRAGVVGLLCIIFIWYLFIKMTKVFLANRNIKGVLLCSALFFWLIDANFAVILELPYFAIPFWSLFGMSLAYCYKEKEM